MKSVYEKKIFWIICSCFFNDFAVINSEETLMVGNFVHVVSVLCKETLFSNLFLSASKCLGFENRSCLLWSWPGLAVSGICLEPSGLVNITEKQQHKLRPWQAPKATFGTSYLLTSETRNKS